MTTPLLRLVLSGAYEQGLQEFRNVRRPTAQQRRWGGVCHLNLGNLLQAKEALQLALRGGEEGARIELAACLTSEGRVSEAAAMLEPLHLNDLSPSDRALALRQRAIIEERLGRHSEATDFLLQAWDEANDAPATVQSAVSLSTALVYIHRGMDSWALPYLEFAAHGAHHKRQAFLHLALVATNTYLGRFSDAAWHLEASKLLKENGAFDEPLWQYRYANYQRARGELNLAQTAFQGVVASARLHRRPEMEAYGWLGLTAVAWEIKDSDLARRSLKAASKIIHTPALEAQWRWRAGMVQCAAGDHQGWPLLIAAHTHFQTSGQQREEIWTSLHLAQAALRLGRSDGGEYAQYAADALSILGQSLDVYPELRSMPELTVYLRNLPAGDGRQVLLDSAEPMITVDLRTLGEPTVLVNGQVQQFQLRWTPAVLAYLHDVQAASFEAIQTDVLHGLPPDRARNYFHQVRSEVKRRLPAVAIRYDRVTNTYSLDTPGARISSDLHRLHAMLTAGHGEELLTADLGAATYLKGLESEWAQMQRHRYSRQTLTVGLQILEQWTVEKHYKKCAVLAERLLEVEPYDEALHTHLIRAVFHTSGPSAAWSLCQRCRHHFIDEVGDIPPQLDQLMRQLQPALLN